ncbi:hypothetical protein FACS189413_02190 [Bacteroidia bacterium]|nr:hypothetical protein FACS189413_02190 [Bacteroidia bacterium]
MQHGLDKLNSYHLLCGYLFNIGSLEDLQTLFGEYETALVQEQPDYYFKHYLLLIDALNASMKYEECRQEAKNTYEEAKERNDTIGMFYSVFSLADIDAKQYRLAG